MDSRHGFFILLGCSIFLLGSPGIWASDFSKPAKPNLKEALACKLAGLPSDCNQPSPVPVTPIPSGPGPAASPPASPPLGPVSPPGPAVPPLSPGPAGPENPPAIAPQPPSTSPPTASPVPSQLPPAPVPSEAIPAPAPVPSEAIPAPAPSEAAPAPAPMPDTPAPAPQNPGPTFVIAAGGSSPAARTTSDIYSSSTGEWSTGPDFSTIYGRYGFAMVQLSPTEVLAAGGDRNGDPTAEIYSAVTQDWQPTADMQEYRSDNSMVVLPDGSAFTAGGRSYLDIDGGQFFATTEQYAQGQWASGPNMNIARTSFTMLTYIANNDLKVLVCGGQQSSTDSTSSCEEWSPAGGVGAGFSYVNSQLSSQVFDHRAVLLNGSPFVTGGRGPEGVLDTAQLLVNGAWKPAESSMQTARAAHEMVVLQSGLVLVCGGQDSVGTSMASCETFNGETWTPAPTLPSAQSKFRMLVLRNGDVIYYGLGGNGQPCSGRLTPGASAWVLIPSSGSLDRRYNFGMTEI